MPLDSARNRCIRINWVGVTVAWFALVVLTSIAAAPVIPIEYHTWDGGIIFGAFAGVGSLSLIYCLLLAASGQHAQCEESPNDK